MIGAGRSAGRSTECRYGPPGAYSSTKVAYSSTNVAYSSIKPSYSSTKPALPSTKPAYSSIKVPYSSTKVAHSSTKTANSSTQKPYLSTQPVYSSSKSAYSSTKPAYSSTKPAYSSTKPVYSSTKPAYSSTKPACRNTEVIYSSTSVRREKEGSTPSAAVNGRCRTGEGALCPPRCARYWRRLGLNTSIKSVASVGSNREMHAIKRGLLWQQRERLFSRWKERYFILTKDYLHCFKKSNGLSPMGQFIFKIKLVELEKVEWMNKKSYSTIGLTLQQANDCRILLRAEAGLEDWYELLEECTISSKERRRALRKLHNPAWDDDTSSMKFSDYISQGGGSIFGDTISVADSDIQKRRSRCGRDSEMWFRPSPLLDNRLSLLTDIDINRRSPVDTPPPSVPPTFRGRPYRLNNDVFFMAPGSNDGNRYNSGSITPSSFSNRSVLTPVGSFRSSHLFNPTNNLHVKYRDRSQSDVYNSKGRIDTENRRASYILPASHM